MTRLLVSVRDRAEAAAALASGADFLDLKEPERGSLGAVDSTIMAEVATLVAGRRPLSVALGELLALEPEVVTGTPAEVDFAKVGLAGCGSRDDWPALWQSRMALLPPSVARVAVVYADWRLVDAPPPDAVLKFAEDIGCAALLIDTCRKDRGCLLDHWPLAGFATFLAETHSTGLLTVVGGSLSLELMDSILPLEPDIVAVRGAVCRENRAGQLDPALVERWSSLVNPKSYGRALSHRGF